MRPRARARFVPVALATLFAFGSACKDDAKDKDASSDGAPDKDGEGEGNGDGDDNRQRVDASSLPEVAPPTSDSPAIADLGPVIATVQVPTGRAVEDLEAAVNAIKPGAGVLMRTQIPNLLSEAMGGMDFDGANLDAAISAVVLDPTEHDNPVALLVKVSDGDELAKNAEGAGHAIRQQDGWALIGPEAVVSSAERFAFANLTKAPDHSEVILYPSAAMAAAKPEIEQGMQTFRMLMAASEQGASLEQMMDTYMSALLAMGEQTERIVVSVSPGQQNVDVIMRVYPGKDTTFASLVAAQQPADHALLAKLPAGDAGNLVVSGEFHAGDAKDALLGFTRDAMAAILGDGLSPDEWNAVVAEWMETTDGTMAMSMNMSMALDGDAPKMETKLATLYGVSDSDKARATWRKMLTAMSSSSGSLFEMAGIKMTTNFEQDAAEHDGVPIDLYETVFDVSELPPEQQAAMSGTADQHMHLATFDTYGAMATASDDGAAMKTLIDAARGKGDAFEASADLSAALALSTERGESVIYYIDVSAFGAPTDIPFKSVSMSMGKEGDAMALRLSMRR